MTFYEYELMIKAHKWKQFDKVREMHEQAWVNREINAKKNTGTSKKPKMEYVYKDMKSFFKQDEYLENLGLVEKKEKKSSKIWSLIAKANKSKRKGD
ncbi:hypothetical protein [Streptococcus parauberis]|uniref:hypothetical protein n=1 Tax=Streptococcus parauberis TaxID=1348 RepID=UPI000E39203C|nr:hypothetical protein [Streptococcus parauberis]RFE01070.1 hypothetical protein ADO06_01943 [Streptococcus parauberis]